MWGFLLDGGHEAPTSVRAPRQGRVKVVRLRDWGMGHGPSGAGAEVQLGLCGRGDRARSTGLLSYAATTDASALIV